MRSAIFIGDELTAAGFRLAGVETRVPEPADVAATLAEARSHAALVVLTADLAAHVPQAELDAALLAETPAFAIVPDVLFRAPMPDLANRLRRTLGIET